MEEARVCQRYLVAATRFRLIQLMYLHSVHYKILNLRMGVVASHPGLRCPTGGRSNTYNMGLQCTLLLLGVGALLLGFGFRVDTAQTQDYHFTNKSTFGHQQIQASVALAGTSGCREIQCVIGETMTLPQWRELTVWLWRNLCMPREVPQRNRKI